ncbi:MAG TPA: response regulator, partial [Verrucomicrobiae bacterium]|nr:response regulator [Verrucomicrobiae bacterium]
EGLAVATREKPDIIILDLTMPVMDGFEMLTKLKGEPDLKGVPVIMLTAEAGRENVLKIAKLGVRDYLIKPFKEDLIVERVSRVIDLKPRGDESSRAKRFDDPLNLAVVDDKPAILDQVKGGLSDTPWNVQGYTQPAQVADACQRSPADAVLVSLSLPDNGAFTLFQSLRGNPKTKSVPVFALSVKTAAEEQSRAQQLGFAGIVTKPIDFEDLKVKITRALSLDTSYKYFEHRNGALVLILPANFSNFVANDVSLHLRKKVTEAVDAGLDKMVIDLGQMRSVDVNLIKLGLGAIQLCNELAIRHCFAGSPAVIAECKNYEEAKDWRFFGTVDEATASLSGRGAASPVPAVANA